jgi:hypothetical protein
MFRTMMKDGRRERNGADCHPGFFACLRFKFDAGLSSCWLENDTHSKLRTSISE